MEKVCCSWCMRWRLVTPRKGTCTFTSHLVAQWVSQLNWNHEQPEDWVLMNVEVVFADMVLSSHWLGGVWKVFLCWIPHEVRMWQADADKRPLVLAVSHAFLLVGESGLPTRVASFPLHQPTNQFFVDENNATWNSTRPSGNIEEAIRSDPTISYVGCFTSSNL